MMTEPRLHKSNLLRKLKKPELRKFKFDKLGIGKCAGVTCIFVTVVTVTLTVTVSDSHRCH